MNARRTTATALLIASLCLSLTACKPDADGSSPTGSSGSTDELSGYLDPSKPAAERAQLLLEQMTLEEKFGQMTQIENYSLSPGAVANLALGSVLHGGGALNGTGTFEAWSSLVNEVQHEAVDDTRLGIPLLFGVDGVHGFGGMYGATVFPQQIGLGAANDPELMTRIGQATAEEMAAAGIRWTFGPVLAVPSDIRWGRTYEAYSQDPARVGTLGAAYIVGLQGEDLSDTSTVLATAKHFVGDGSTVYGSSTQVIIRPYLLDQGNVPENDALLTEVLLPPYQAAIDAGALSVMATFSSWGGDKVHGIPALLTDTLRGELGFQGFVVSDWAGCDQIDLEDFDASVVACINAGVDMVMVPFDAVAFLAALKTGVDSGAIPMERIDEAVLRILTVKFEMGLFENPYADPELAATVANAEHRALAREAVQKSLVLLKNDDALPIAEDARTIVVVGNAADDMGAQAGGWTMSWQGSTGAVIPGTTILEGIRDRAGSGVTVLDALPASGSVDVCVAVPGEEPYAEGVGDSLDLSLPGLTVLNSLEGRCGQIILVIVSGRPVIITGALPRVDAVVAAWQPGTAGEGLADVLFGDVPFTGTLPMNWPASIAQVPEAPAGEEYLFPLGFGLTDEQG